MAIDPKIIEATLRVATGGLSGVIFDTVSAAIRKSSAGAMNEPIEDLRIDTERQKLAMEMAQAQARVAQELAIAHRIQGAKEVQIEEYYEYAGEGSLGLKGDEKGLTLGASASGQRVSKRIYKFIGNEIIEADTKNLPDQTPTPPVARTTPTPRKKPTKK